MRARILVALFAIVILTAAGTILGAQAQTVDHAFATVTVTPDATGWTTVNHGLSGTPAYVDVSVESPNSGAPRPDTQYVTDYTATTFRVRFIKEGGTAAYTGPVTFRWEAWLSAGAATTTSSPTTVAETEPGPTVAECLVNPTTVVAGVQTARYRVNVPPALQTYDMRTAVWNNYPSGSPAISRFGPWMIGHNDDGFGLNNCVLGPRINGTLDLNSTRDAQYATYHGGPYLAGDDVAGNLMTLNGGRTDRVMDCIRMNGSKPPAAVVIKNYACFDYFDDFIENDFNPTTLTIYDSLMEGFMGVSERPDASNPWVNPSPPDETTLVQKTLMHLKPMGTDHLSCGAFKWDSESTEHLHLKDTLVWYEQAASSICTGTGPFPAGMTAENSKVLWTGSGAFPYASSVPSGMTIETGATAQATWDTARADWCIRHPGQC